MGSDINPRILIMERNRLLDKILNNLRNWDGTIESGLAIVENNEENINEIKAINLKLNDFPSMEMDEEYEYKISLIIEEQKKFTAALKSKQQDLLYNFKQLGKRKDVAKNYISNKTGPIFIDKDL